MLSRYLQLGELRKKRKGSFLLHHASRERRGLTAAEQDRC
jgi:hypothetical protein